jgi:hypothetical protein
MTTSLFHPATLQLVWLQSRGRRRRWWAKFCQPRRLILSAIACILTILWLGNTAMTIWLRQQASQETLHALLSWGFVFYSGWHVVKAAFFRPESALDLSPDEQSLLLSMPLRPRDLVAYQFASITMPTLLKAGLFTLLLLPDLHCFPLGLLGILLGMALLELLRMAVQICAWALSRRAYLGYRTVVVVGLVAVGLVVGALVMRDIAISRQFEAGGAIGQRLVGVLIQLHASEFGLVGLPFEPIVNLTLADALTPTTGGLAIATIAVTAGLATVVTGLYAIAIKKVADREKRGYATDLVTLDNSTGHSKGACNSLPGIKSAPSLSRIPHCGGAGPLAWRQLVGVRRKAGSVATAMVAPAILAAAPAFTTPNPHIAFLISTGALAFYTFLLLPTALRFDFRRDLDRLAILKGMPLRPFATAAGQIFAPVFITTIFQAAVLSFVALVLSLSPMYPLVAMLIILPLSALVFGLDNLIYLLYPYRVQQEGLEIFLRTMLTFTGKGLLFTIGLAAFSAWGLASTAVAQAISNSAGGFISGALLFVGGTISGLSLFAALVIVALSRRYGQMDVIEDVPR